jgi:GT2 family glycosyltransferase
LLPFRNNGFPSVSVIVCAYSEERWDDLLKVIQNLHEQLPVPDEIILVIDQKPPLFDQAQRHFPMVKVLPNKETRGLSGARNSGVHAAQGEILVFIDEDAWPEQGWLAQLLNAYTDPSVLGAGGAIVPEWDGERPAWFPEEFDWVVGCTYKGMPDQTSPVRNMIGANMSFHRSVFEIVGGFNHTIGVVGKFPSGCEETELAIRARLMKPGGILLYIPSARVHHRVPISRSHWSYFSSRCYAEGLSKAMVTHLVGASDGLGSERIYTLYILPVGVLRGLEQTIHGDIRGLQRALAIIAGLFLTTIGYLVGKLRLLAAGKRKLEKNYSQNTRLQHNFSPPSQGDRGVSAGQMRGQ